MGPDMPGVVNDDAEGSGEASLSSTGGGVFVAGLSTVDSGDAGSVKVASLGFVGIATDSA